MVVLHILRYFCVFCSPVIYYGEKVVSDLQQVGGFLQLPPTIKLTTTILLKYCLKGDNHNNLNPNPKPRNPHKQRIINHIFYA
jgi:hypothetical protein